MKRIAFVGISYNTNSQCVDLLRSFDLMPLRDRIDVVFVNNSAKESVDHSLDDLKAIDPKVLIINAPQNLGYFGGARAALGRLDVSQYDWIIVANVDIEIRDRNFFEKLVSCDVGKNVGVVAPSLLSSLSGGESNPFLHCRPKSFRMAFYRWIFSNFPTSWTYHLAAVVKDLLRRSISKPQRGVPSSKGRDIYAAHGAFLIFTSEYFRRGGDLNHGAFMYGEEIFVAEVCRRIQLREVFVPTLQVYHTERVSTGVVYSKKVLSWKRESSRYLWKEFFSGQ